MPHPRQAPSRATIKRWLTPIIATLLALACLLAVMLLERDTRHARSAQLSIANIGSKINAAGVAPLQLVDGLAPVATVTAQMRSDEAQVIDGLAALQRSGPAPGVAVAVADVTADFAAINAIRVVLSADPRLSKPGNELRAVTLGLSAERAGTATTEAVDLSQREYSARVNAAQTRVIIGSALAILGLLAVFLVFYRRWLKVRDALAHDALTDALTGLPNRRALIDDIGAQLDNAAPDRPLVLALYDLDGFKDYNDTFGHIAGDAVLSVAGDRLNAAVRGVGRAYRMGGDEFCTLTTVGPSGVAELRERASAALLQSGENYRIDSSCGTALIPAEAKTADDALRLADHRMYAQKMATVARHDKLLAALDGDSDVLAHRGDFAGRLTSVTALGRPR